MPEHDLDSGKPSSLSLSAVDLPSQQEITCEELHYLISAGAQLLRNLEIVGHDLALMEAGKRIVFALDFSELATFLWPDTRRRSGRQAVYALFSSDRLQFTLPPGAQVELVRHMRRLIAENKAAQQKMQDLMARPFVAALMQSFEERRVDAELQAVSEGLSAILNDLAKLGRLAGLLRRFVFLGQMKTLLPIGSLLGADEQDLGPDPEILRECTMSLNLRRPGGRQINNYVDAHNYSLLWTLSNAHVNTKNTVYLMITSSPIPYSVFRKIKWSRFPETVGDPTLPELSLVRHPTQVLYLDAALRQGSQAAREVRSAIASLNHLLKAWSSLPRYKAYANEKEKATTSVRLPRGSRYLNHYLRFRDLYQRLYSSVREIIETDLSDDENIRRLLGVSAWPIMDPVPGGPEAESQLVSTRISLALFDRMNTVVLRTLERFEKSLSGIPPELVADVDVEGVLSPRQRLVVEGAEDPEFECHTITVLLRPEGLPYFSGDLYSDYYSLWWPTALTFAEFLNEARGFLGTVRSSVAVGDVIAADREKQFDGLYLYAQGQASPLHLSLERYPDLNADDILGAAEKRMLTMVRIATQVGDVFYEFLPLFGQYRRVGVMSHLASEDATAWLIHGTNLRRAGFVEVQRITHKVLSTLQKGGGHCFRSM